MQVDRIFREESAEKSKCLIFCTDGICKEATSSARVLRDEVCAYSHHSDLKSLQLRVHIITFGISAHKRAIDLTAIASVDAAFIFQKFEELDNDFAGITQLLCPKVTTTRTGVDFAIIEVPAAGVSLNSDFLR